MSFAVTASDAKGQVERDPRDDQYLRYQDGSPYLPMGHNVAFQQGEPVDNDGEHYVEPLFASMETAGPELDAHLDDRFQPQRPRMVVGPLGRLVHRRRPVRRINRRSASSVSSRSPGSTASRSSSSSTTTARCAACPTAAGTENPYNAANGGPVPAAHPEAFFTERRRRKSAVQAALALPRRPLRRLPQRPGLGALQRGPVRRIRPAANPGNSAQVRDDIVAWHAEMAAYLRDDRPLRPPHHDELRHRLEPQGHLGRPEHRSRPGPRLRARRSRPATCASAATSTVAQRRLSQAGDHRRVRDLPGPGGRTSTRRTSSPPDDREAHLLEATHLHNAAWAAAMSGSGAMSWWWGAYIHSSPSTTTATSSELPGERGASTRRLRAVLRRRGPRPG